MGLALAMMAGKDSAIWRVLVANPFKMYKEVFQWHLKLVGLSELVKDIGDDEADLMAILEGLIKAAIALWVKSVAIIMFLLGVCIYVWRRNKKNKATKKAGKKGGRAGQPVAGAGGGRNAFNGPQLSGGLPQRPFVGAAPAPPPPPQPGYALVQLSGQVPFYVPEGVLAGVIQAGGGVGW
jgi:cbb3-type cytochrome oxidase subunit 3